MNEEIRELQQALKSDPSNRKAFDSLADQYAANGDWRRLRWHYEKFSDHVDAEEDPKEKSAILVALGDVLFEHHHNHDDGMTAYQTAFATYKEDTLSLDRARDVYRKRGDFQRVLLVYNLECGVKKETPAHHDVRVRMAQVHGDFLGDRDEALSLLASVIDDAPEHEMARLVQEIYQAGGTVEATVVNQVREGHQRAQAGEQQQAADSLLQAAKLERFREGGGLSEAAKLAEKARAFDPEHGEVRAFLTEVYEELERQDDLRHIDDLPDEAHLAEVDDVNDSADGADGAENALKEDSPEDVDADALAAD